MANKDEITPEINETEYDHMSMLRFNPQQRSNRRDPDPTP
jgi:hypothetical protein